MLATERFNAVYSFLQVLNFEAIEKIVEFFMALMGKNNTILFSEKN